MAALSGLLERVSAYSSLLKQQMERVKTRRRVVASDDVPAQKPKSKARATKGKKRAADEEEDNSSAKRVKVEESAEGSENIQEEDESKDTHAFVQPVLVTGATLRDYQLEGVAWMAGLYNNGISGILGTTLSYLLLL